MLENLSFAGAVATQALLEDIDVGVRREDPADGVASNFTSCAEASEQYREQAETVKEGRDQVGACHLSNSACS